MSNTCRSYDVVVIGSGFGAGPPALRLAEAGCRVLVVEKGPEIVPARDFRQTQDPQYLMRWFRGAEGDGLSLAYIEGLGGGSAFYEMVTLRAPTLAFEHGWPEGLDRIAMDPWYESAEQMLRVSQISPERVPRTGQVFARMMNELGYTCERARYAENGCVNAGFCVTGCIYNAKMSPLNTYIPRAREAGATYLCGTEAVGIERVGAAWQLTLRTPRGQASRGTECLQTVRASRVILAGGTVGTARFLMSCRRSLPGLSNQVGRNIAWNGGVKAVAVLCEDLPDGDMYTGRTHAGMISYEFLESHRVTVSAVKAMPLMALASHRFRVRNGDPTWGKPFHELMKQLRHRVIALYAMGLAPAEGFLELKRDGSVAPGVRLTPELKEYYARTGALLDSLLARSGCTPLVLEHVRHDGTPYDGFHAGTAHQVGSCRMSDRAQLGVCDRHGQIYGCPGLYITDGSAVPSSLAVNPSLTILANSERITDGILHL